MTPDPGGAERPAVDYLKQVPREERLADKVADLLKKAVLSGQLKAGDRLPPERVLGERFGVSRTVVREAIRGLAAKGLVEVRSGSGTVVARVGVGSVAETMQLYLRGASIEYAAIHEVRTMLEAHVAAVAAQRANEIDLDAMREVQRALAAADGDAQRCAAQDAAFHRAIARATQNPLNLVVLESIGEPIMTVRTATIGQPGRAAIVVQAHQRIVDCIASRNPEGARQAMLDHLADSRRVWEQFLDAGGVAP